MGAITIQVGALSRSISAPDAKMTRVLGLVVAQTGGPVDGTAAQQADHILALIRNYLVALAADRARVEAIQAAEAGMEPVDLEN